MLSSFTWQQYLLAAGATSGLYYLVVLLLYYREDFIHLLKGKSDRAGLPADQPIPPQVSIMGPASHGPGPLLSEAATVLVAPQSKDAEKECKDTVVEAILQEISPLLELATKSDAEKEELLPLLRLVTSRYIPVLQLQHRENVERYLIEQGRLPFTLSPEELQSLWNEAPSER